MPSRAERLALAGCVPHAFTVPAEALAFAEARAGDIGIVITDYEMPDPKTQGDAVAIMASVGIFGLRLWQTITMSNNSAPFCLMSSRALASRERDGEI